MDSTELTIISDRVQQELADAASGQPSSFPYIHNPLPTSLSHIENDFIQVLVFGGSVFKKALFKKGAGKPHLLSSSEKPQPVFNTASDFLSFLQQELSNETKYVAVNFAYPINPVLRDNRLDGILISGTKENRFEGLVGKKVGEEIEAYIKQTLNKEIKVSMSNDTICLLLSGLGYANPDSLAAGVIGTGLNFAFFQSFSEIINLEAANFDKLDQSLEGQQIDANSASPGRARAEKEIAGGYLYQHYNYYIKNHQLSFTHITSTEALDALAEKESEEGKLAKELLRRSAMLSASIIAGITKFRDRDLTFVIEGSLFWKGYQYKEIVEQTTQELLSQQTVTFLKIEDSSFIGSLPLFP